MTKSELIKLLDKISDDDEVNIFVPSSSYSNPEIDASVVTRCIICINVETSKSRLILSSDY